MFFSQDILQKRGGKFGIIWIAATKATQLTKREYCSVNIHRTCEEIIRYLMLNASPLRGGSRPRLSLYLSSQLMYGVIRVFDKQQDYLITDATTLSVKFHSSLIGADIDLRLPLRSELVAIADVTALNRELGADLDPEFGVMRSAELLHPDDLPIMDFWDVSEGSIADLTTPTQPSSSTHPVPFSSPPPPFYADIDAEQQQQLQTSIDQITLKELPLPATDDVQIPGESELPPLEVDNLLNLCEGLPAAAETDASKTESDDNAGERQVMPVAEVTPSVMPELEEMPQLVSRPPPTPGVTPIVQLSASRKRRLHRDFNLELSPATPPFVKRARHRRQLLFADQRIQLTRDQQKHAMRTGHLTSRPLVLPNPRAKTVADLFGCPGRKDFGVRLDHLWKRNAVSSGMMRADQEDNRPAWTVPQLGETSGSSEMESPRYSVQPTVPPPADDTQLGPVEVRCAEMSSSEHLGLGDITSLHGSLLTRSRDSTMLDNISDAESIHKEGTIPWDAAERTFVDDVAAVGANQLDVVEEMPEEQELMASPVASRPGEAIKLASSPDYQIFLRLLNLRTRKELWTTFLDICPLTTPRAIVAKMFSALLDVCALQQVQVKQETPFGDIYISRGRHW